MAKRYNIYEDIVWLTDKNTFYSVSQRRPMSEVELQSLMMVNNLPHTVKPDVFKINARTFSDVLNVSGQQNKPNRRALMSSLYQSLKPYIKLRRRVIGSASLLFIEHEGQQVEAMGACEVEKFKLFYQRNKPFANALNSALRSDTYAPLLAMFDTLGILEALFRQFETDLEVSLDVTPAPLSWGDRPAFRVLDPDVLQAGDTPTWDEFTNRLDFPEIFKAFVWSIFEPQNFGRQLLWIQGAGKDGKSSVADTIIDFIGAEHVATIGKDQTLDKFFVSKFLNKRFGVYADCSNPMLLSYEVIKSIVSGDQLTVEAKYEHPYTTHIYSKLLVLSNMYPTIDPTDNSLLSRLLILQVSRPDVLLGDPTFKPRLQAEFPAFLVKCKRAYDKQCPTGADIIVPPEMQDVILAKCSTIESDLVERFVQDCIEFEPDSEINRSDLYNAYRTFMAKNWGNDKAHINYNRFRIRLAQFGLSEIISGPKTARKRVIKGGKLRNFLDSKH